MADTPDATPGVNRVLVKLRASAPLAASERRANLRPVFDRPFTSGGWAADLAPQWLLADMPDRPLGPTSVMSKAIAAYTPNIPWPQYGYRTGIRLNGEGTSAATPQVAAAAALWFENYKQRLPRNWHREGIVAEVVRACDAVPQLHDPIYRRLRVYAVDPSFSTRLETVGIDETTLQARWESFTSGRSDECDQSGNLDRR